MRDWSTMSPATDGSSLVAHAISFLNRPSLLDDVSREQMPSAGLECQSNALPPSPPSSGDLTMGAQTALVDWEMSSSTPGSEVNPFVLPATPSVTSQASTRMPTPMLISDLLEWESLSSTFDADFNLSAPSNAHTSFMPPDDTIGANIGGPVDSVETQPSKSMDMYGAISQGPYPVAVTDDFWSTKSYAELYMPIKEEDQWKKTAKPKSKPSMRVKCTELGCTKTFSSIHNMNEHRRTHVLPRERAYVCPECHSDYIHRRDQHRHMRHKHGYPPKSRARKQTSPKPKDN
ncbi:hypothetical protein PANT_22c00108 [Moesziomyces antarcticus T-34]|uniref:C2H2-type domain-containing protein n=1 Tax=Pseudozyma antarctica (strain T-34) TaxID=1151754 RepID=M9MI33_PSEA3|nr:hypothetical protein PANT_22c00108 [Moesziomyces antarcticus T-34]